MTNHVAFAPGGVLSGAEGASGASLRWLLP